jgi:hypothetical protein
MSEYVCAQTEANVSSSDQAALYAGTTTDTRGRAAEAATTSSANDRIV